MVMKMKPLILAKEEEEEAANITKRPPLLQVVNGSTDDSHLPQVEPTMKNEGEKTSMYAPSRHH